MDSGSSETRFASPAPRPVDAGRFAPGTILADRYRIVALAGRGGMGEVYRADDQRLGQTVALKFLPVRLEHDPEARDRLMTEVRSARSVSHPNVCRVYDVGDVQGRYFMTMEYIDGEDLASLLRRIGRLPATKALEIARQLCAGLAAAHDRSVLHRDLKPSNVMIDGRGHARIADFGLATEAGPLTSPSDIAGTIAYMAPERFQGQPATVQSDLYALGLTLYETYTGKPAFKAATIGEWQRAHTDSTPTIPSALVTEIEPAVERAIMRCLEKDPARRPSSAAQVAASLPGGDPLAAALAAGETPSPELVAASGDEGTLPRAQAWLWFTTCLTALVLAVPLGSQWHLANIVPSRDPVLQTEEARHLLQDIGYTSAPADSTWWFRTDDAYMRRLLQTTPASARFAPAPSPTQGPLIFCYRQSSVPLFTFSLLGDIRAFDPAPLRPDDAYVELQSGGGLRMLRVGGLGFGWTRPPRAGSPPWPRLFAAAGLELAEFTEVAPKWSPVLAFDTHVAWEGRQGGDALRVEGVAYRGWPVEFRVLPAALESTPVDDLDPSRGLLDLVMVLLMFGSIAVLAALARRNARMGRGDKKGALRLALVMFVAEIVILLLNRHWIQEPLYAFVVLFYGLGLAFSVAVVLWLYYLGLEPYVRRRWPQMLIGWTRLVEGRWGDPLVGRRLLAGTTAALLATAIIPGLAAVITRAFAVPIAVPWHHSQLGPTLTAFAGVLADRQTGFMGLFLAFFALVILLMARLIVRKDLAAWAITLVVFLAVSFWSILLLQPWVIAAPLGPLVAAGVIALATALVLARHGLLACVVFAIVGGAFLNTPVTYDVTRWYASRTLMLVALVVGLAVWGFKNVLGRQTAFPGGVFDE